MTSTWKARRARASDGTKTFDYRTPARKPNETPHRAVRAGALASAVVSPLSLLCFALRMVRVDPAAVAAQDRP